MNRGIILKFILLISISLSLIACAHIKLSLLSKQPGKEEIAVADEYYKKALEYEKKGDIYNALYYLKLAIDLNQKNKEFSNRYNSIIVSLYSEISGTQEVIKRGNGIMNPVIYKVMRKINKKNVPVQGMPVHFRLINATGSYTHDGITNDIGEAKCFIDKIKNYTDNISVEAYVTIPKTEDGTIINKLTKIFTFTNLSVMDSTIKILMESNNFSNMDDILGLIPQSVADFLKQSGFSDVNTIPSFNVSLFSRAIKNDKTAIKNLGGETASDILILLVIDEPITVQQSFDFYLKKIIIQTIIADSESGMVYFKSTTEGKGAGRTEKGAEEKAISNALTSLEETLKNYVGEVKTKNDFFRVSTKG